MGAHDVDPNEPPPVLSGQDPGPPDFVGVGVQKAGTTWWYETVAAHREVHSPSGRPKELHYFDRFWAEPFGPNQIDTYHRWFARPAGALAGEWTPRYLHDWWSLPLLVEAAPGAKLLVMLRDPIERYRSGVAHEVRSRRRRDPLVSGDALARSRYGQQLERLLRLVPPEQLLVQQFERCITDPVGERRRTWDFLGLDHDPAAEVPPPVNARTEPGPGLPPALAEPLATELRSDLAELLALPVELDLDLWPSAAAILAG